MPADRRPRPRRTWPQRLFLALNIAVIVGALASAAALAFAKETVSDIERVAFQGTLTAEDQEANEPLNFLLVGVDSIANLDEDDPLRKTRDEANLLTDTMIVLRVDPSSGEAAVLSIPRDLWVPYAGLGWSHKINSALAAGGEETLVRTIQEYLDIPIHRYAQVDFNAFLELMKVLGGVDVQIDYPLRDVKAQLDIPDTGCVNLKPRQALGYVRSRTLTALVDGEWQLVDQTSDFGRIQRQQDFLVIALQKAFDQGLRNPNTLRNIIEDTSDYVRLDDRTSLSDLVQLGRDFDDFRADNLRRYSLPVTEGTQEGLDVLYLNETEAQRVLNVFRGQDADNISFRLTVHNGTGETGLASLVAADLTAGGFNVVESSNADHFGYLETVIRYDPSQEAQALIVERWLASGATLEPRETDTTAPLELIAGEDWAGLESEPRPKPTPSAGAVSTPTPADVGPTPTPTTTPEPLAQIRAC